jgi:hypothetical protein
MPKGGGSQTFDLILDGQFLSFQLGDSLVVKRRMTSFLRERRIQGLVPLGEGV